MKWAHILLFVFSGIFSGLLAQPYMRYQAVLRNSSGVILPGQTFLLKAAIREDSPGGPVAWEETFTLTTLSSGFFEAEIGNGSATGLGIYADYDSIPWNLHSYYLEMKADITMTGNYENFSATRLLSVPYTLFARQSKKKILYLNNLPDVDTSGIQNSQWLEWNGTAWVMAIDNDRDSCSFSINIGSVSNSDTATYVLNFTTDTVVFSNNSDSSVIALNSQFAGNALQSSLADTVNYAYSVLPRDWLLNGNSISTYPAFAGTTDSVSFGLFTNSLRRIGWSADGNMSNNTNFIPGTYFISDELFIHEGPGSGTVGLSGAGTRWMWVPEKGAFRAGGISGNEWDSLSLGWYSMVTGYNSLAGDYSFAAGSGNIASGDNAIVFGRNNSGTALGSGGFGTSFCVGDSSIASGVRTVVLGSRCQSGNSTAITIGYNSKAIANVSTALGSNVQTGSGLYSVAMGSYVNTANRQGCFVYGDRSSTSLLTPTANHQFIIRASGGVVFYSDSLNTTGVELLPGSGSWSSVSDSTKKKNISPVNHEETLEKIARLRMYAWSYVSQHDSIVHIGPVAQSFHRIFRLGENNTSINTLDADGIVLSGLKGIYLRQNNFLENYTETKTELESQKDQWTDLDERIKLLEEKLKK